jgi:hypothetical protein
MTLVRATSAIMWDLRSAWAAGWRVSVSLDGAAEFQRLEGHVQRVSATDAYVVIAGWHVPAHVILAVHRPTRLGDSTARDGSWHGPRLLELPLPGQRRLPGL